ncbi:hypothetical protein BaRGS_00035002, partial [Batillaria attramentaria]
MSSTDKERLADSILVEMLQEQITELSSAEKTIKIAISDLEGGQTIAALQRLLGEVKGKIERLRNFTTSLSSSKNKPATWAELRRLRKSCRPPPAGLLHDWKRGADSLRKAWEVVDDKTVPQTQLTRGGLCAENSTTDTAGLCAENSTTNTAYSWWFVCRKQYHKHSLLLMVCVQKTVPQTQLTRGGLCAENSTTNTAYSWWFVCRKQYHKHSLLVV